MCQSGHLNGRTPETRTNKWPLFTDKLTCLYNRGFGLVRDQERPIAGVAGFRRWTFRGDKILSILRMRKLAIVDEAEDRVS